MAAASDDPPPPSAFADDVAPTTTSSPPGERAGGRWSSSTSSVAFDPDMSGREGVGVGGRRRWVWRWILIMLHSRGAAGSPHLRNKSHDVYQKREIKNLHTRQKVGRALFCCMLCSTCQDASEDSHRPHQQQGHPTPPSMVGMYVLSMVSTQHTTHHFSPSWFARGVYGTATSMMTSPAPLRGLGIHQISLRVNHNAHHDNTIMSYRVIAIAIAIAIVRRAAN